MSKQSPLELSSLGVGDSLSYEYCRVRYNFTVIDASDERALPAVEISAAPADKHGAEIVAKLNESELRGILLGTCDLENGELVYEGRLSSGAPDYADGPEHALLVEMVQDGEMVNSVFPLPSSQLTIIRAL